MLRGLNRLSETQHINMGTATIQKCGPFFHTKWQMKVWDRKVILRIIWKVDRIEQTHKLLPKCEFIFNRVREVHIIRANKCRKVWLFSTRFEVLKVMTMTLADIWDVNSYRIHLYLWFFIWELSYNKNVTSLSSNNLWLPTEIHATCYRLDGPGIESRWEVWFSAPFQTSPGAHPASCKMDTGSFPGVKTGRGVTLTPHPLLVPRSRKGRAIPLHPLWALRPVQSLSTCTRVHFTFTEIHDVAAHYTTITYKELRFLKATTARHMCYFILNSS
jgi:hypothetical protein